MNLDTICSYATRLALYRSYTITFFFSRATQVFCLLHHPACISLNIQNASMQHVYQECSFIGTHFLCSNICATRQSRQHPPSALLEYKFLLYTLPRLFGFWYLLDICLVTLNTLPHRTVTPFKTYANRADPDQAALVRAA